ncbi:MAG: hypothetical protein F6J93_02120 [Oscillatoria sp. SIO1A7]|nr:hypothetical protein [Oscillatoria sp. SIO1A7]
MAYFYSIRGWLELEPESFDRIISEINFLQKTRSQIECDILPLGAFRETPLHPGNTADR